jgi:hypothetical protein
MADVFVSYKSADRPRVQPLVLALRAEGLSVWWDQDIPAGAPWESTIEGALREAKAAVVVWSPGSVSSENVKSEARWALRHDRLVQVFVAPCEPPLFFGERQGVSLHDWAGDAADRRFEAVVAATKAVIEGRPSRAGPAYAPPAKRGGKWKLPAAIAGAVVVLAAAGISAPRWIASPAKPAAPASDLAAAAAQSRARLLQSIVGTWDRQGTRCDAPITIRLSPDIVHETTITVSGPGGFSSVGQVITAEDGRIVTRDIAAASGTAGETWEYQPRGALMNVLDGKGTPTALVRCAAR